MNVQMKAFEWSLVIHGLFIGAVIAMGLFFKNPTKLLVINFDLEPRPKQIEEAPPTRKAASLKPMPQRKTASLKALPVHPKEKPPETPVKEALTEPPAQVTPFPSEQAVPVFSPVAHLQGPTEKRFGSNGGGGDLGLSGGSGSGSLQGSGQSSGKGEEKAQARYLREHFAYIRDRILKNIHYPYLARRMGWEGKVLLSFVVTLDGSIKEPKIMQSSGFDLLDKNAAETIKDTAPYPKPPVEARLVIPIMYRLN